MKYIIATRGSALAISQARAILSSLSCLLPDDSFELKVFATQGDKVQDRPIEALIGTGVFVKELERALLSGEADLAIHSLKDVPSIQPPGLEIIVTPPRESARDVLIISPQQEKRLKKETLEEGILGVLKEVSIIGTSSPRRSFQLRLHYPKIETCFIRGNIDTRIKALSKGEYDGIVVAQAALSRLGLNEKMMVLPLAIMTPAPGQGCLALECRSEDRQLIQKLKSIHHLPSWICVKAERLVMSILEAGCKLPFGAHGELINHHLNLSVFFGNEGNQVWFRQKKTFPLPDGLLGGQVNYQENTALIPLFESVTSWAMGLKNKAKREDILR